MKTRFQTALVFSAIFILLGCVWGCGKDNDSDLLSDSDELRFNITFKQWCQNWNLVCPTGEPENVPSPDAPWTVEQWKAALGIYKAFLESASDLGIKRTELNDPILLGLAKRLKQEKALDLLKARLDGSKFSNISVKSGKIKITASEPADYVTKSHLVVHNDQEVNLSVNSQLELMGSGILLKSQNGASDGLKGLSMSAKNVVNILGESQVISQVPIKYSFEEILGIDLGSEEQSNTLGYKEIVPELASIRDWLVKGQRDLDLRKNTITEVAKYVSTLTSNSDDVAMILNIMKKMDRLYSTATSRAKALFTSEANQSFQCVVNKKVQLTFSNQFGLTSLDKLSDVGTSIMVFGVKAKLVVGPVQPSFTLGRIDLEKEKIVVQDVPVLGSYTIDLNNTSSESNTLTCN